jgi:hypothetical protein
MILRRNKNIAKQFLIRQVGGFEDSYTCSRGAHRGKKEKVEAFEHSKFFQIQKKSAKAQQEQ